MNILSGLDNSVLFVFILIFVLLLYILYNFIHFISEKHFNSRNYVYNINSHIEEEDEEICAICTDKIKSKIETDCRHHFCGRCLVSWMNQYIMNNLTCPICRSQVRLINLLNVTKTEQTKEFYDDIVRYNYKNLHGYRYVIVN